MPYHTTFRRYSLIDFYSHLSTFLHFYKLCTVSSALRRKLSSSETSRYRRTCNKIAPCQKTFGPPSQPKLFSRRALMSRNKQHACAKVCVIKRAFSCLSTTSQPIRVKETHIIAELTVPLFRKGLKLNSHLLPKILSLAVMPQEIYHIIR